MYKFANPEFLWGLLIIPFLIAYYFWKGKKQYPTVTLSSLAGLQGRKGWRVYLRYLLPILRMVGITLLIIALARPQSSNKWESTSTEGIDIMLALDISSSMLAQDFKPDRIEAAKAVASEFISGRPTDRIGLVVFSGQSFTQCPLTTDHAVLINLFHDISCGMIEDGTAIGLGLANAVHRIKDSDAISKVVILLTDGVNNQGSIDPMTAAEIAKTFGIRVYTIGVGSKGMAPYPVQSVFGTRIQQMETQIDEELLKNIAAKTNGKYFRATSNDGLKQIYTEIDGMEKSKISVQEHHKKTDEYFVFLLIGALCIAVELILRYTILKQMP